MEKKIKTFALIGAGGGGGTPFNYSGIQIGTGEQMNVWTGTLDEFKQLTPDEHTVYFIDGGGYVSKPNWFYVEGEGTAPVNVKLTDYGVGGVTVEVSRDGEAWEEWCTTESGQEYIKEIPVGEKLYMRSKTSNWGLLGISNVPIIGGNILSLVYGSEFDGSQRSFPEGTSHNFNYTFSNTGLRYADKLVIDVDEAPDNSFANMFEGCIQLETPPQIRIGKVGQYGCSEMFAGCALMMYAPDLTASEVGNNGYYGMFRDCSTIVNAPTVAATSIGDYACSEMFMECKRLIDAPALTATAVNKGGYSYMFDGCTSLVNGPELPATTISEKAYVAMFDGCSALQKVGKISATSVDKQGCSSMFRNCKSLVNAPELPATTVGDEAYYFMFHNCTSLVDAPALPATTIGAHSYSSMFMDCTSLAKAAPILPAVNVPKSAYSYMYAGCTALTDAGEMSGVSYDVEACSSMFYYCTSLRNPLIITPTYGGITVGDNAFLSMFKSCTSLERVPNIAFNKIGSNGLAYMYQDCPSLVYSGLIQCADAANKAYNNLFNACSNMRYIIATDSSYNAEAYVGWTTGLPDSGVFIKSPTATWPRGVNGIPEGWVIVDEGAERGDIMYYKSTDGLKVEPNATKFVDENGDQANILSNEFQGNLGVITFDRNVARITGGAFSRKTNLKEVWLPFYLTDTGDGTFDDCTNLELIHMWYHITRIGATFNRLPNLSELFVGSGDPPTLSTNQAKNLKTYGCPIYVPAGSLTYYRQATNWSTIADQIKAM